ncbi:MAG: hypothetical protein U1E93_14860 [Alphaproteobacteria bacterium]
MPEVNKVLLYTPFAFIWPHAVPEFQLAQILVDQGLEVKAIGCNRSYATHCTSMEATSLPLDADPARKDKVCRACISNRHLLAKSFPAIPYVPIEDYQDGSEKELVEIPQTPDDILNFKMDGVDIGRLALYEPLIKFKKFNMDLSPRERQYFETYFRHAVKVLKQANAVFRKEKPDVVICYSPQYVITGVFAAVAAREGIRVIFVEGSANDVERYSHLRMWDWGVHGLNQPALKAPSRFENFKLTPEREARARKLMAVRENASAHSAYTNAAQNHSPYEVFGLDKNRKYILMAMSSYDEVYSGFVIGKLPRGRFEGRVFKNQIEWLKETIAWIADHPELQLVVRPHPREFPNVRENIASPHVKEWQPVLESLPPNVKIDHPDLKFSLYDHMKHVDVLMTGWSSTGVEALSKGVPVVTYDDKMTIFPPSIHYTGSSRDEYFANILRACQDSDRERNIRNATRWLAYTSEAGTVKTGGRIEDRFKILTKFNFRRYLRRFARNLDLMFPPSKEDAARALALVEGKGPSLFELPDSAA